MQTSFHKTIKSPFIADQPIPVLVSSDFIQTIFVSAKGTFPQNTIGSVLLFLRESNTTLVLADDLDMNTISLSKNDWIITRAQASLLLSRDAVLQLQFSNDVPACTKVCINGILVGPSISCSC